MKSSVKATSSLLRIDLRRLILWMCVFFTLLALGNSLYAAYVVQRNLLLEHNLQVNRVYVAKLAHVANSFFDSSALILEATALDLAAHGVKAETAQAELEQVAAVSEAFNALIVVDKSGEIFASHFRAVTSVTAAQLQKALPFEHLDTTRSTLIIGPFRGASGRWLSLIAHPIFLADGSYAGYVAGALSMQSESTLQNVLNAHHSQEQSYFYIVNNEGTVVYHPTLSLIGTSLKDTPAVQALMRNETGALRISDAQSTDLLVSYAPIPIPQWGIVMQHPTHTAFSNVGKLFLSTVLKSLPLFLASLLAIWWLARLIARPLRELADIAANLDDRDNFWRIRLIKSWYLEAALLRRGLLQGFSAVGTRLRKLHREGATDPLTGLLNRRGLEAAIKELGAHPPDTAVLMIDVDHFKTVNDSYGHAAGDQLLKAIAATISAEARSQDVVARSGGEEFIILLPETDLKAGSQIAERMRAAIEKARFIDAGSVTISVGVAAYPKHGADIHECLSAADGALYDAKAAGRNRIQTA